jgi:type IV pilus assembly protein PilB
MNDDFGDPALTKELSGGKVHWLVRIAERAGFSNMERPDVALGARAVDVWSVVARAYGLPDERLAGLVAEYFHLRLADLGEASSNAALVVSESTIRRLHVFPLFESDRHLIVATCDPTDMEAERTLGFSTGRQVVFAVAPPSAIRDAIDARFPPEPTPDTLADLEGSEDAVRVVEELGPETITEDDAVATPVIELTNVIIRDAITAGAEEIHLEPGTRLGSVRFRVDGVLRKHMDVPLPVLGRVISRVKEISRLDVTDHRRPQEGKARVRVKGHGYDLHINTTPVDGSERCVVHVREPAATRTLDDLDIPPPELDRLRGLLGRRDGLVLVAGPEGSGKTTTAYAALRELADESVRIVTLEDPVEYDVEGMAQTFVAPARGMPFATALQTALRQDSDVLFVGEIRDPDVAVATAQAVVKGRLVLATLRADDAVDSLRRLAELGVPPTAIAPILSGVVAQRLLRRVCTSCAEPVRGHLTPDERRLTDRHGIEPVVRAVGCSACRFRGYRGRIPAVEVLLGGPRVRQALEQQAEWDVVKRIGTQGGMRTLHDVGLEWVERGRTTLVEVERILGPGDGLPDAETELDLPWIPVHG